MVAANQKAAQRTQSRPSNRTLQQGAGRPIPGRKNGNRGQPGLTESATGREPKGTQTGRLPFPMRSSSTPLHLRASKRRRASPFNPRSIPISHGIATRCSCKSSGIPFQSLHLCGCVDICASELQDRSYHHEDLGEDSQGQPLRSASCGR